MGVFEANSVVQALQRAEWVIDMAFEQNRAMKHTLLSVNEPRDEETKKTMHLLKEYAEKNHRDFHGNIHFANCHHDICREINRL